jgi:uncharacterized protein YdaU (DUF1376 family)
MSDLPPPLVEAHVDCSDLDGFMLNAERLMSSELLALHGNDVLGAALLLWCRAWKQRPAGSLPDDDRINAAFARLSLKKFREIKEAVMRGFVKCSDGRLYHKFLSAEANKAYARKVQFRERRAADAKRLKEWRDAQREAANETQTEMQDETRLVADGNGKDRDRDIEDIRKDSPSESPKESSSRGRKLPPDWRPTDNDWTVACRSLGGQKAEVELAKFRDYWPAKPGGGSRKLDWDATWRNWVRRAAEQLPGGPIVALCAEPSVDLGGEFREVPTRNLPGIVKLFEDKGAWPYPTPKPGEQGCRVPSTFLPQRLQARGTTGR